MGETIRNDRISKYQSTITSPNKETVGKMFHDMLFQERHEKNIQPPNIEIYEKTAYRN